VTECSSDLPPPRLVRVLTGVLRAKWRPRRICCSLDLSGCASAPPSLLDSRRRLEALGRVAVCRAALAFASLTPAAGVLFLDRLEECEEREPATEELAVVAVVTEEQSLRAACFALTSDRTVVDDAAGLGPPRRDEAFFFWRVLPLWFALLGDTGGFVRFLRVLEDDDAEVESELALLPFDDLEPDLDVETDLGGTVVAVVVGVAGW